MPRATHITSSPNDMAACHKSGIRCAFTDEQRGLPKFSENTHTAATRQQQCRTSPLHTCAPNRTPSYKNQASRCACSTLQLTGDLFLHSYKCSNSEFVRPSPQRVERVPLHIRIYGLAGHWALLLRTGAAGAATGHPHSSAQKNAHWAKERHPGRAFRAAKSRTSRKHDACRPGRRWR